MDESTTTTDWATKVELVGNELVGVTDFDDICAIVEAAMSWAADDASWSEVR